MRASRKGLSPLLAIIIGLVVTIVAGILLAQLYFSYAATISARPAANVEYVDLVVSPGTPPTVVLALNIKNMGSVEVTSVTVHESDGTSLNCDPSTISIPPGGTAGIACSGLSGVSSPGDTWTGYVKVQFGTAGSQIYAISARARSA